MDSIFFWLATGLGTLLSVAVIVAWWEYLGHKAARQNLLLATDAQPDMRRAVTVDVNLDAMPSDSAERRSVLDDAMARMTQPGSLGKPEDRRKRWQETSPMVGPGMRGDLTAASAPTSTEANTEANNTKTPQAH